MNNATATPKATRESSTTVASPSAEALAGTTEEEALKKSEQLNGNATANKDTANGNINNTTTTNNTTTSASTTTTATATTRTTTNGNANTNNTEEEVDNDHAHANKTKLGKDHLINDYDIKQKNSTSNSKKMKIEPPSKNPFGDYDDDHIDVDDDEEIYEVPKDATTTDLPPGVLYRVKATYGYARKMLMN
ncbi:hypothetical protein DOY81_009621 [Sarcophaga bullata]|nr:hypothetical protein DOY81_009621 [Sarcophaga bullata]